MTMPAQHIRSTHSALVSGGSYKFHMAPLAAELAATGSLTGYITAGWPSGYQEQLAKLFPQNPGWKRFLDRKEAIPDDKLHSQPLTELFIKLGDVLFGARSRYLQQQMHRLAFGLYRSKAKALLGQSRPDVYHYRNCYGGSSVTYARELGIPTLCDHSIAHPLALHNMERHQGQWPAPEQLSEISASLSPLERAMMSDLALADYLLVNSDFVKQTCVQMGWSADDIYVVYLGIDDSFRSALDHARSLVTQNHPANCLLFAGGWQQRKGAETLAKALEKLPGDWQLTIAGGVDPDVTRIETVQALMARPNVHAMGILPRAELAKVMVAHRIFVFPSYCEGSARVVFEALAAGCYVITTPNSGSIVQDRVHGRVVPVNDEHALAQAILEAIQDPQMVENIGIKNQALVAEKYLQSDYGTRVRAVYEDVVRRGVNEYNRSRRAIDIAQ